MSRQPNPKTVVVPVVQVVVAIRRTRSFGRPYHLA
jgi:hypothetical protein